MARNSASDACTPPPARWQRWRSLRRRPANALPRARQATPKPWRVAFETDNRLFGPGAMFKAKQAGRKINSVSVFIADFQGAAQLGPGGVALQQPSAKPCTVIEAVPHPGISRPASGRPTSLRNPTRPACAPGAWIRRHAHPERAGELPLLRQHAREHRVAVGQKRRQHRQAGPGAHGLVLRGDAGAAQREALGLAQSCP